MNEYNHQKPTQSGERIQFVDILRGFALIGVLLMNMNAFSGHAFTIAQIANKVDKVTVFLLQFFLQAKFYSLFSLLFGWGMAAQLARARTRGSKFIPYYIRRNTILLAIGLIHAVLIWDGDILVNYAILAFLLLILRDLKPKTLLLLAAACLALSIVLNLPGETMDAVRNWYNQGTSFLRQNTLSEGLYAAGSYRDVTRLRIEQLGSMLANFLYWLGSIFSMFLVGFYIGKREIFKNVEEHLPLIRTVMWVGLIVGLVFNGIFLKTNLQPSWVPREYFRLATSGARTIGAPALMLFYVSAIILSLRVEYFRSRLVHLAPVGRMALSNYLGQSILCTLLFYGYGLGLYGQISPTAGLILSIFIYIGQMRFSAYWLERYQFGPVEWLWRSLAYGARQPLRQGQTYADLRPLPFKKSLDWLKRIPQKTALIAVWVVLLAWAGGLILWNGQLVSQGYYDPFTIITRVTATPEGIGVDDPGEQPEEILLAPPDVEAVSYDPGPIAESGDMVTLASTLDMDEALTHIEELSDPVYEGRYAGTPGGFAAGEYIADKFAEYGLQPAGDDGSFFQGFPIYINQLSDIPTLLIETRDGVREEAALYQDFAPITSRYIGGGIADGPIFWGNQCDPDTLQENDLVGRVVLCQGVITTDEILSTGRSVLEYGAEGLLLLTDPDARPADFGSQIYLPWVPETIPAFRVYPGIVDEILAGTGYDLDDLLASLPPTQLESSAAMALETLGEDACPAEGCLARNVLGVIPGRDPDHAHEVIILGGHYDHMGASPDGTIWAGADDNASGVAALLEIARSWQEQGYVPRRTVVFAAWDAEELGLLGSSHYVEVPRYPLEDTVGMIQLDMVGAGAEFLTVSGEGDFQEEILATAAMLGVDASGSEMGRSDHIPFWEAGVPAGLLIWWDDATSDHLHRMNDTPAVIDPESLMDAARIANLTLLNLAESEPAILAMLEERERASEDGDRMAFLATSRVYQRANDRVWFDDLQNLDPGEVDLEAADIQVLGDTATARIHIRVEYPGPASEDSETEPILVNADLDVRFERGRNGWVWGGPDLVESPEDPDTPAFQVFTPPEEEAVPGLGAAALEEYAAIAGKLGLPVETTASVFLLPSREALRTNISLSLPQGLDSWTAPGEIHLVYDPEVGSSELFSTALAQLALANAGIPEDAAPWLWDGLPLALAAEEDPRGVQSSLLPDLSAALEIYPSSLTTSFTEEEPSSSPVEARGPASGQDGAYSLAASWAGVDALLDEYGWTGSGAIIQRFGASCQASGCATEEDREAAYLASLRRGSRAFESSWREKWKENLEGVQSDLDDLMRSRVEAILAEDLEAFIRTVDPSAPNLRTAEENWAAHLIDYPPDELVIYGQPLTIYENGRVLASIEMDIRLGGATTQYSYPVLINRNRTNPTWMGAPFETLYGSGAAVRYPAGRESLAQELLGEAEMELGEIAAALEISPSRRLIVEVFDDPDSFKASIFTSYPLSDRTAAWTAEGENIKLYLPAGSDPEGLVEAHKSELSAQIARWLLGEAGVDAEWLLKGVSSLITRHFDGGAAYQEAGAAYPQVLTMLEDGTLPVLTSLPGDHQLSQVNYNAARTAALDSVRYLVETYGWNQLLDLLDAYTDEGNLEDAVQTALGISLTEFETNWKTSLSRGHSAVDQPEVLEAFDPATALSHIDHLSSPEMGGRQAGTPGDQAARDYIADQFAAYGLIPVGNPEGPSYFQEFEISTRILSAAPRLEITGTESPKFIFREDFSPIASPTEDGELVRGDLVFVEEYEALEFGDSLAGTILVRPYTTEIEGEIEEALNHGAVGIILLGDEHGDEIFGKEPEITAYTPDSLIPVFQLTRSGTRKLAEAAGHTNQSFAKLAAITYLERGGEMVFQLPAAETMPTANILGFLPGSDPFLSQEILIIGAHYDHVGDDPGNGLRFSGRNDDASGISGLLEIARVWQEHGYRPKRSVLFAAWGAQELGQIGSSHYVEQPIYPLEDTIGVIQLDGIGGGDGFYPGVQAEWESDGQLLFRIQTEDKWVIASPVTPSDHFAFQDLPIPEVLISWRLANEDNLPDDLTNQVSPEKLEVCGKMALQLLMAAAR